MTIHDYFGDWCKVVNISEAERLAKHLATLGQPVCPNVKNVFRAFTLCSLHNLKVVVLGQDPYPDIHQGRPTATGIAFGNSASTAPGSYSPSLDVLMESVINFTLPHTRVNFDPTLEKWEAQGVLMLNSALSCIAGKPGSHALLWRPFIRSFLTRLSAYDTGVIYVLMGAEAQSFESCINARFNYIIKEKHPSWYARTHTTMPSSLWLNINSILHGLYGCGIEWFN